MEKYQHLEEESSDDQKSFAQPHCLKSPHQSTSHEQATLPPHIVPFENLESYFDYFTNLFPDQFPISHKTVPQTQKEKSKLHRQESQKMKQIIFNIREESLKMLEQNQFKIYHGLQENTQERNNPKVPFRVKVIKHMPSWEVVELYCQLGIFSKKFIVLNNIHENYIHRFCETINETKSFGNIYKVNWRNQNYAIKCIELTKQSPALQVIKQIFITIMMSALQIGPKIKRINGFDFVVSLDCIEFGLELCQGIKRFDDCKNELRLNLLKMHSLNICHIDIKSMNIMYSLAYQKHVFIDFGLTSLFERSIGTRTWNSFEGNLINIFEEMNKVKNQAGYVDMYTNDKIMLQTTLQVLSKIKKSEQRQKQKNSKECYNQKVCSQKKQQFTSNTLEKNTQIMFESLPDFLKDVNQKIGLGLMTFKQQFELQKNDIDTQKQQKLLTLNNQLLIQYELISQTIKFLVYYQKVLLHGLFFSSVTYKNNYKKAINFIRKSAYFKAIDEFAESLDYASLEEQIDAPHEEQHLVPKFKGKARFYDKKQADLLIDFYFNLFGRDMKKKLKPITTEDYKKSNPNQKTINILLDKDKIQEHFIKENKMEQYIIKVLLSISVVRTHSKSLSQQKKYFKINEISHLIVDYLSGDLTLQNYLQDDLRSGPSIQSFINFINQKIQKQKKIRYQYQVLQAFPLSFQQYEYKKLENKSNDGHQSIRLRLSHHDLKQKCLTQMKRNKLCSLFKQVRQKVFKIYNFQKDTNEAQDCNNTLTIVQQSNQPHMLKAQQQNHDEILDFLIDLINRILVINFNQQRKETKNINCQFLMPYSFQILKNLIIKKQNYFPFIKNFFKIVIQYFCIYTNDSMFFNKLILIFVKQSVEIGFLVNNNYIPIRKKAQQQGFFPYCYMNPNLLKTCQHIHKGLYQKGQKQRSEKLRLIQKLWIFYHYEMARINLTKLNFIELQLEIRQALKLQFQELNSEQQFENYGIYAQVDEIIKIVFQRNFIHNNEQANTTSVQYANQNEYQKYVLKQQFPQQISPSYFSYFSISVPFKQREKVNRPHSKLFLVIEPNQTENFYEFFQICNNYITMNYHWTYSQAIEIQKIVSLVCHKQSSNLHRIRTCLKLAYGLSKRMIKLRNQNDEEIKKARAFLILLVLNIVKVVDELIRVKEDSIIQYIKLQYGMIMNCLEKVLLASYTLINQYDYVSLTKTNFYMKLKYTTQKKPQNIQLPSLQILLQNINSFMINFQLMLIERIDYYQIRLYNKIIRLKNLTSLNNIKKKMAFQKLFESFNQQQQISNMVSQLQSIFDSCKRIKKQNRFIFNQNDSNKYFLMILEHVLVHYCLDFYTNININIYKLISLNYWWIQIFKDQNQRLITKISSRCLEQVRYQIYCNNQKKATQAIILFFKFISLNKQQIINNEQSCLFNLMF